MDEERDQEERDHDRIVAAATAAATVTLERAESVLYSRKINFILALCTLAAVSYGVGMTVSSVIVSSSMQADIARIDVQGSEKTKQNSTDIIELKTKYEASAKNIEGSLDELKKMVMSHILLDKKP